MTTIIAITIISILATVVSSAMSYVLGCYNNRLRNHLHNLSDESLSNIKLLAIAAIVLCILTVTLGFGTVIVL